MNFIEMARIISANGGRLYFVGGYVRDKLMGIESHDIDFCITGMNEDKFMSLFPYAFKKGKFFPVFQIENYEFAFARSETKIDAGHNGFIMNTENITIEEDLRRRDITINSIALDVLTNEFIDPFNGISDIKNKIIRATSNAFIEDPLRTYRVARFATKFNKFSISDSTITLMQHTRKELPTLSPERIFEELKKSLSYDTPSRFFYALKETNLLDIHFKEIFDLIDVIQPIEYHPEGDVFTHSMQVLDGVAKITYNHLIRFAALTHDLGKGITPKEILPHHYEHDKNGIPLVKNLCNRLKLPNEWKKLATLACAEHMKAGIFEKMNINSKVSFIERNYKYLKELEIIAKVDSKNSKLEFYDLGKELIENISGKTIDLPNDFRAKQILHEKRIQYLRNME
ncbi:MAG: HD domain-containing protein [Clostridiales bacterium]|nr:HD domain-containing protein [Clostridiales bacterium]